MEEDEEEVEERACEVHLTGRKTWCGEAEDGQHCAARLK